MSLIHRPAASGALTDAHQAALMPLLRTAKRVKRSLIPVQPSQAFQASLEGELLGVARRLALGRGNAPRTVVTVARPPALKTKQATAILGGLAAASITLALALLIIRAGHRRS